MTSIHLSGHSLKIGPSGISVGFFTGLKVAVRPQTLHRSPRQAFGGT